MTTLRSTISQLANEFAAGVLEAIRGASLQEILAESGAGGGKARRGRPSAAADVTRGAAPAKRRGRGGRLGRRSAGDIAGLVQQIVQLLEANPEGLRAEQIREQLGLEAKELPRPIADALSSRKIAKQGQKRATTYFARGGGGGARAKGGAKAGAKAGAKKSGRKSAGKKAARGSKRGAKKRSKANASSNGAAEAS
jgi:hypothetical protein